MSFLFSFLSFSACGKKGRKDSTYLLYVFVIFLNQQNIMFDRNNNLLPKKNIKCIEKGRFFNWKIFPRKTS